MQILQNLKFLQNTVSSKELIYLKQHLLDTQENLIRY